MDIYPFNALRMGPFSEKPENWERLFPALRDNRPAFDEFWFSTGCSFPKIEWHEESARRCAKCAEDLRGIGMVPSIEMQTILGHNDTIPEQNGENTGATWVKRVEWNGTTAKYCPCPRDPVMQAYFKKVAVLHAAWHPGIIYVDDDFCVKPRCKTASDPYFNGMRGYGCFCPRCLNEFSKYEGHEWTRGSLIEAMRAEKEREGDQHHSWLDPDYGETGINRKWLDFQLLGLADFARELAAAVHAVSPETRMGYQFGRGHVEIAQALAEGSIHPIRIRPGAGSYYDTYPRDQIIKAYQLSLSSRFMGEHDFIEARCPEIESCPRTVFCRTPQGVILEAFENIAFGMDFLSMFVANWRANESVDYYHKRLFPRIAKARPFLEKYRDANRGAKPCGFTIPGDVPDILVSERGLPIVTAERGIELGKLPPLSEVSINGSGSGWGGSQESRAAQIMSGPDWRKWIARADEVSCARLPVVMSEPAMAFVVANVTDNMELRTVAFVNASIDRQEPQVIKLRGVPEKISQVKWHIPECDSMELKLCRLAGGDAETTLPEMGAWQCGYIEV